LPPVIKLEFSKYLKQQFAHVLTRGQDLLCEQISDFIYSNEKRSLFVLKGYAGTGKTTAVSALVKSFPVIKCKTVLLAPTGRAAKVLSNYSKKQALTIHKKIYRRQISGGAEKFVLQQNLHTNTVFIVDEASMISNAYSEFSGNGSLLDDLFEYVYSAENCRLIFVGDTAQLPPVGLSISPALDEKYLEKNYSLKIDSIELTEVVRQDEDSGILHNATLIRNLIQKEIETKPRFDLDDYKDIIRINGTELEDALNDSHSRNGAEETMVICRSNKRANIYNQQIRTRVRYQEEEISSGDYMMVVKNNYHWLPEESKAGFIANGDIFRLSKIGGEVERYGFRFADVRVNLIDYPDEPELECKILLDTITSESPSMNSEDNKKLYYAVFEDYKHISNKRERMDAVKKDKFFNALQVKFAYAVTCHKAQGGQWQTVFVEQGYLTDDMINIEYLRWLYTALTRATKKLYLVNFNNDFFP